MFSEVYGYKTPKDELKDSISKELRNRIWNVFYSCDIKMGGLSSSRVIDALNGKMTIEEVILDKMGFDISSGNIKNNGVNRLKNIVMKKEWYKVYDFIELHLSVLDEKMRNERTIKYNQILEEEKSFYRVVNGRVTPITNPIELNEVSIALDSPYSSVNKHISKALELYSRKQKPDYENSIKESISAVESICCILTNESGGNATLGRTLKKLKKRGITISPTLESAFAVLYGYTCDEGGIRHGKESFTEACSEEAKFMIVACSAFVNYLVEKNQKVDTDNCSE